MRVALVASLALVLATGCVGMRRLRSASLAGDYNQLDESLDVLPPFAEPDPSSGSLWTDAGPGAAMVRDPRAFRLNDLVTISVQESSLGSSASSTGLKRASQQSFGATNAFGLEKPTTPTPGVFNLASALNSSLDSQFNGDGATSRSNKLAGYITARVMRVLPNGDLVIAGQKTVMVNRDRQILTLVGTARVVDIGPDNQIASSAVGDLVVRLWGRGELDDNAREGWFIRIMHKLWPF